MGNRRHLTETMLARLKRANRRCAAPIWAMALVFALAPVISIAFAVPAGAFSRFLIHSHADGDDDHVHHGHHHLHHGHDHYHDGDHDHDSEHHQDDAVNNGSSDQGQHRLHVHYDASCPSVLVPEPIGSILHRVVDRVGVPPIEAKQGAPPGRLLRPPIPLSI